MKLVNKFSIFSLSLLLIGAESCKKSYLDRKPSDLATFDDVFASTKTIAGAVQGMNRMMYDVPSSSDEEVFGQKSIDLTCDLMGEDMPISARGAGWFLSLYQYVDSRQGGGPGAYPWTYYYQFVNNANEILVHLDAATGTQEDKNFIKAQALFYRAFAYYNLSIFYQHNYASGIDINTALLAPIYTEPTRDGNRRATVKEVFDFMINDIKTSVALFEGSTQDRRDKSEVNIDVAKGLYARIALSMRDWNTAATMAHAARQGYDYMLPKEVIEGFNEKRNTEWIWGSTMVNEQTQNTKSFLGQMDIAAGGYAALGQQKLVNRVLYAKIDANDARKGWWYAAPSGVYNRYSQKKFLQKTPGSFATDVCYMRSAEMGLIEAEALAQQGKVSEGKTVLEELIKNRLATYSAPSVRVDLLKEIWWQRRIELWGEGFRFGDIQRTVGVDYLTTNEQGLHRTGTNFVPTLIGSAKDFDPNSNMFLWRLPSSEINNNPNIPENNP